MFQKIEKYGTIRPLTAGNNANTERLKSLANLGQAASNIAFDIGKKKRIKEGQIEGAKAGTEAAETGVAPEEKSSFIPRIFDDAFNDAQQGAYLASVDNQAITKLSELESQFAYDVEGYQKTSKGMLDGLVKNAPEAYRQPLIESINNYISRGSMRVNENTLKQGRKEAKSELLGAVDTYSREASRAARNGDADQVQELLLKTEASALALVASNEWTKEQADEAVRAVRNETTEQAYLQIVDDMSINEASKAIDDAEKDVLPGFSPDEHDMLIAKSRTRLQGKIVEYKRQNAVDKSGLRNRQAAVEIAMKTGEGDPDDIMKEITSLFHQKVYTPTQYAGHVASLYNGQKETQAVWDRIESGDASVLVETKAIDKVYRNEFMDADNASKVQFVESVNYIPSDLKKEVGSLLYSGDVSQAASAADMIKRMSEIPSLVDTFPVKDKAYASQIVDLIDVYSPEEAIRIARKNTDPRDKDRIQARESEIADYKPDFWSDGAESALGSFFGSIDPMVLPSVSSDYKSIFKASYTAGMSESDAQAEAEKRLKQVYSEWNGRHMKHSPEKYYSVDGSTDWIKKELIADIRKDYAGHPEIQDFYFITDDRTEREAAKGRPTYLVRFKTDAGWDMLMGRYMPDIDGQKASSKSQSKSDIESIRRSSKRKPLNKDIEEMFLRNPM